MTLCWSLWKPNWDWQNALEIVSFHQTVTAHVSCLDDASWHFLFLSFLCRSWLLDIVQCTPDRFNPAALWLTSEFDLHLIYEQQLFPFHFSLLLNNCIEPVLPAASAFGANPNFSVFGTKCGGVILLSASRSGVDAGAKKFLSLPQGLIQDSFNRCPRRENCVRGGRGFWEGNTCRGSKSHHSKMFLRKGQNGYWCGGRGGGHRSPFSKQR